MAKASGSIDLKTYNKASQEATNYLQFDSQTGLTIGQANLNSKVNISGGGVKLYDENGKVGTEISSGEVIVGTEGTNQIALNNDGIVLSSVEDIETFKAGVGATAVAIEYRERFFRSEATLSKNPDSGSRIEVDVSTVTGMFVASLFTQGVAETQNDITYDGERTFTLSSSSPTFTIGYVIYTVTAHPPYLTFGTRDTAGDIGIYSATFGRDLIASKEQAVFGKFNVEDTNGDYSVIVGNGSSAAKRNALALDNNGALHLKGDVYVGCNADSSGGTKLKAFSGNYNDLTNKPSLFSGNYNDLTNKPNIPSMPRIEGDVLTVSSVLSNKYKNQEVTFATPFNTAPLVVAGLGGTLTAYGVGNISVAVNNVTKTGFTARVYNASGSDRNVTIRYIAIQP